MNRLRALRCAIRTLFYTARYQLGGGLQGVTVDGHEYGESTFRKGEFEGQPVEWEDIRCGCGHVDSGWRRL